MQIPPEHLDTVWLATETPMVRYERMTRWREWAEAVAERAVELQARALADANADGMSYADIAAHLGVSRARAQQLVQRGREIGPPKG